MINVSYSQIALTNTFLNSDSAFVEITWDVPENHQITYSINRFTEDSQKSYTQGFWLYDRTQETNTWENYQYGDPCSDTHLTFDTTPRGNLNRVNVVSVKLLDTLNRKIIKDSVYIIGFGTLPHKHYTLFATVDSSDLSEVFSDYENEALKKRAWLHILKPNGVFEVSQPVEFDIAAGSSACYPNKGIAFKATKDNPIKGPNNFKTSIFSKDYKEEIKKIKMRVGGNGQDGTFGINEICLRIINYHDWKIGGVRNTVGTWYVNGSYWSLGFPQVKPEERYVAEEYHIDKDSVDIIYPIPFNIYFDTIYAGFENGVAGNFVIFESTTAQMLGLPDTVFYTGNQIDSSNSVFIQDIDGRKRVVANPEEGTSTYIQPIFQSLVDLQKDTITDHYFTIDSLINLDSWLRYLCLIHYFGIYDAIYNNVNIGLSYRHKPFILMEDFDWILNSHNNWDTKITYDDSKHFGIMHEIIQNVILKSPKAIDRMILVYQDLLNTGLLPSRTVQITEQMIDEIMPEYGYHFQSWGGYPNGGIDSNYQHIMLENFKNYLATRPDISTQLLTDRWQPKDSFNITDRKTITVIFDSIPENSVQLKLNSLNLDSNFIGLYFPNPDLQISYTTKPEYNITIKEYPDSNNFNLSCDSNITLTFVLREKVVNKNSYKTLENDIKVYPNPSKDIIYIESKTNTVYSVNILDLKGAIHYSSKTIEKISFIDIHELSNGVYFLKLENEKGSIIKKFIKQ